MANSQACTGGASTQPCDLCGITCKIPQNQKEFFNFDIKPSKCLECGHFFRIHSDTVSDLTAQLKKLALIPSPEQTNSSNAALQAVAEQDETKLKDGQFRPCSDPFYSKIAATTELEDWLQFESPIPLTENCKLYIRSSYKLIAENALLKNDSNRRKYAIVTGTPGIGKSVFAFYLLWTLIKNKKRVLFFQEDLSIYFDGNSVIEYSQLPTATNRQFWAPDMWCIIDSNDPIKVLGSARIRFCSVLLVSTLRRDCISKFKKLVPTPAVFYMPLWTQDELKEIESFFPVHADVWLKRFKYLGGVPRLILEDITVDPEVLLRKACHSCSIDDCIKSVDLYSEINLKTKIAQTLIHVHSESPYETFEVRYASEKAVSIIVQTKHVSDRKKMQSLLGSCAGNPLAAALCGYIFEPYAINLLEKGGKFVCRELVGGKETNKKPPQQKTFTIPKSAEPCQYVDRVESNQSAGQLYAPQTSNYPGIDAWMPGFGGFQITVAEKHNINSLASDDLQKLGTDGNRLFFVLPPLHFGSFTKQTPQTIEQYALLIPYPKTTFKVSSDTSNG